MGLLSVSVARPRPKPPCPRIESGNEMRSCLVSGLSLAILSTVAFACGGTHTAMGTANRDSATGVPGSSSGGATAQDGGGSGSSGGGSSGGSSGGGSSGGGHVGSTGCGAGDPLLPAEPTIPPACTTLQATQAVTAGALPNEDNLDTAQIQSALNTCPQGQSVKLTTGGANNAFIAGPLLIPGGVALWIDEGTTLYASRNPNLYGGGCGTATGSCLALLRARGPDSSVVGAGTIDGQGGEPMIGSAQSWWDLTQSSNGTAGNPPLIQAQTATHFTIYGITLHNGPKAHVKIDAQGFVAWGIRIKTPSGTTNSQGTPLSAANAQNTDGIDPGEAATDGYIVCSSISTGDDQIAIKGRTGVDHVTIAHNHFGAGHGMSIGSETNGGVSNINVYDLSIDGTGSGMGGGSSNGIRIKSDPSQGGVVSNVVYSDVCVREVVNPIVMNPRYSTTTGALIPTFSAITVQNFHFLSGSVTPRVILQGFDAAHPLAITLDNVIVDGISSSRVSASFANVTRGPGNVNFNPSGSNVTVTDTLSGAVQPNPCTGKWTTF
jgi:polygalacturonase